MIIDFHTHMFPDAIAEKTISHLAPICGVEPYTNGTAADLLRTTEEAGIDISIALPVVTKPKQFQSINNYSALFRNGKILGFGGIHPDSENYKEDLNSLKEMGFKGIKLHPDYQGVYFNDIRYKRIVSYATELDFSIVVHAGVDPLCPDDVHCTPSMSREVIRDCEPAKLILAHMGANLMANEVEDKLVGENVYFDTAFVLDKMEEEQFIRMCRNHGTDRILFATDCPWGGQKKFVDLMSTINLTVEEKEKILCENAKNLLNI